jgi:hypothetical protein
MSWQSFKNELKPYLDNPSNGKNITDFAKAFASAYDNAVRQGGDLINRVSIQQGQKDLLEFFTVLALVKGVLDTTGKFNLLNELGKGIEMYWTGAILNNFPIPPIPAPGSTSNIGVQQNIVTSPGSWPNVPFVIPTTKTETFLNVFVLAATIHLLGVKGAIITTSIYPPNGTPAPGFVSWSMYLLKPPIIFKSPELEGIYYISQNSPATACNKSDEVEGNTFPPRASIGDIKAIDVSLYQGVLNNTNFYLSDGNGYREFKWVSYPRIAVPISAEVQSCPIS